MRTSGTEMPFSIVYLIDGKEILILGICHRKAVYPLMESRQRNPG